MKPFSKQAISWSLLLGSCMLPPVASAGFKLEPASNTVITANPSKVASAANAVTVAAPNQAAAPATTIMLASDDTQSWPLPVPLNAPKARASATAGSKAAASPPGSAAAGASAASVASTPPQASSASSGNAGSSGAGDGSKAPAATSIRAASGVAPTPVEGTAPAASSSAASSSTAATGAASASATAAASATGAVAGGASNSAGAASTFGHAASAGSSTSPGSASKSAAAASIRPAAVAAGNVAASSAPGAAGASTPLNNSGAAVRGQHGATAATPTLERILGPNTYDRILRQDEFRGLSKEVVLKMQRELALIYRSYPDWERDFSLPKQPLEDGIVGPVTLFWLQRFCFNFKVAPSGDFARYLPQSISRIAAFGKAHPQDLPVLLSSGFAVWDDSQGEPTRSGDFAVRAQGTEPQLLELLARYRASRQAPESKSGDGREGLTMDVWTLTGSDLETVGGKDQVVLALKPLAAKTFDSNEALKVAVKQALGGNKTLLDKFWPDIEAQILNNYGYQVDRDTEAGLRKLGVPESVVTALASLHDDYFTDKAAFGTALAEVLKDQPDALAQYATPIEDLSAQVDSVGLNAQALTNLKKQWQGNMYNAGVPVQALNLLKQIQDVSYPELRLFQLAARAKLQYGFGGCKLNMPLGNQYLAGLRVSDDDMAALEKAWSALDTGPATRSGAVDVKSIFARLTILRARLTICDKDEMKAMTADIETLYKGLLAPIVDSVARKQYPFNSTSMPIQWSGNGCGCIMDDMAGLVVGFYPFWSNSGKQQVMNFSVLSRVAYYGLSFDDLGEIKQTNDQTGGDAFVLSDGSEKANKFILEAQTHTTKVDWVISRHDWKGAWGSYPQARKRAILKKLANNIMNLLNTRLTDSFSRAKPVISLGTGSPNTRGDGVTLYFSDFPADADSVASFNEFYEYLKKGLSGRKAWVNILLPQYAVNEKDGAFGAANLVKLYKITQIIENGNDAASAVARSYFMVLMEEPASEAKKRLRLDIEAETSLRGIDRADFLRRVVPVLQFDNRNWQQLDDDIVYFKDNFAGIGFWPLPLANLAKPVPNLSLPIMDPANSCVNAELVALCLLQRYQVEGAKATQTSDIQKRVCEHRWALRATMDLFVLLDLIVLILFFQSCTVQGVIRQYFLPVVSLLVLPPVVVFMLLLFYDPAYSRLSQGNVPFIIAVVVIIIGIAGGYFYLRSQREKPSRQRALPQRQNGKPVRNARPVKTRVAGDDTA